MIVVQDMNISSIVLLTIITFASNATPFFGAPYTIIASIILLKQGFTPINYIIISVITGISAAAAKIVMYGVGYGLKNPLKRNKNIQLLSKFISTKTKYFIIVLFILAILPGLPFDDYLFIGGGAVRASLQKMEGVAVVAKILKSFIEIYIESKGISFIHYITSLSDLEIGIISFIVFLVIGFILLKIDWEKYISLAMKYLKKYENPKL